MRLTLAMVFTFLPVMGIRKILQNSFAQGLIGKFKCLFDIHKFIGTLTYVVTCHKNTKRYMNFIKLLLATKTTLANPSNDWHNINLYQLFCTSAGIGKLTGCICFLNEFYFKQNHAQEKTLYVEFILLCLLNTENELYIVSNAI